MDKGRAEELATLGRRGRRLTRDLPVTVSFVLTVGSSTRVSYSIIVPRRRLVRAAINSPPDMLPAVRIKQD